MKLGSIPAAPSSSVTPPYRCVAYYLDMQGRASIERFLADPYFGRGFVVVAWILETATTTELGAPLDLEERAGFYAACGMLRAGKATTLLVPSFASLVRDSNHVRRLAYAALGSAFQAGKAARIIATDDGIMHDTSTAVGRTLLAAFGRVVLDPDAATASAAAKWNADPRQA